MLSLETAAHIKTLYLALTRLRKSIEAADIRASLPAGANISEALAEAWKAEDAHSKWLLTDRE